MNTTVLSDMLARLVIFKNLRDDPVIVALSALLAAGKRAFPARALEFASVLYPARSDLTAYIRNLIACDDNYYIRAAAKGLTPDKASAEWLKEELDILSEAASYSSEKLAARLGVDAAMPAWQAQKEDFSAFYANILREAPTKGYGMFAKYRAFKMLPDGTLSPVLRPDPQTQDSLYGYERERKTVYDNTKALISGLPCNNILLYGDAGTGKSSTVKAIAGDLAKEGVRLIQVDKNFLRALPLLLESLWEIPLKFIIFIDDLTFNGHNNDFTDMKTILEGGISVRAANTVIYATSNRRRLIRETFSDRTGDDVHISDTREETSSLAARFGITVTFSKPNRDGYFDLVRAMAKEYGLTADGEDLTAEAERFALAAGGRTPRVAKQYIIQSVARHVIVPEQDLTM